jgi:hypothetical protein
MVRYHISADKPVIAELTDKKVIIGEVQDILDLFAEIGTKECNRIIIDEANLHPDFFSLKTGLAGEILQKFSNYRIRLAVTGDFSRYKSRAFQDFIRESNKTGQVCFVSDLSLALEELSHR